MTRNVVVSGAFALALLAPSAAHAATDAELAQIRDEIRQLKESYEARIQALERRLQDAEARTAGATASAPAQPAAPSAASAPAPAPVPVAAAGASAGPSGLSAFNPAISAVLQGVYANLSQDPNKYAIHGFVPSGDIAPAKRGFSIAESELGLSASVDDKFAANLIFSLAPDNSVEVEEAYGIFTAVPNGFAPKFGALPVSRSAISTTSTSTSGISSTRRCPYQAFLGGQFKSDGLQLKWVAPTDTFLEFGGRSATARASPAPTATRTASAAAPRTSTRAATSGRATAGARDCPTCSCGRTIGSTRKPTSPAMLAQQSFSGKSQLAIADFVWKWAPNGNAMDHQFQAPGRIFLAQGRRAISRTTPTARSASPARRTIRRASAAGTSTASTSSCRTGA